MRGKGRSANMSQKLTYLYCRLSKEDGDALESNSIGNQKKLLTDYAERNGLTPYVIEVGDGYSGANFQRPRLSVNVCGDTGGERASLCCQGFIEVRAVIP
jgi:hypothetical protein